MKLMVAPHDGAAGWAEAEETELRSYTINHEFNKPARCTIILADPLGVLMRKYNTDAGDIFVGGGRVTLEDPTGTDMFYGRIERAIGNSETKELVLECYGWLIQLDDTPITYDMREKLSGDLRQSYAWPDSDGATVDVAENAAGTYYFYDDNMNWANDAYNSMKLVFTGDMAGSNSWKVPPYTVSVVEPIDGIDNDNNAPERTWVSDGVVNSQRDNDGPYTVTYSHKIIVGHNTPSDFYVHDSISGARVTVEWALSGTNSQCTVTVYDNNGAAYVDIGELDRGFGNMRRTFEVPEQYVPYVVDANGIAKVQFQVYSDGVNNATLYVDYLDVEVDVETTGYSSTVTINDTINPNKLEVATDLTAAATRVWPMIPYCIVQPIPYHLDTDLGGTLFTTGDDNVALTATNVELTSGISTRQYIDKTRLQIARDLAEQDKAFFWIPLATTAITYKQTFGADTVQIDDGDVLEWATLYDFDRVTNSYHVYGMRIGDYQIDQTYTNAASETKYQATKTKVLKNAGITSDAEALAIATTLATRDCDPTLPVIRATIAGNTATAAHAKTMVLGDIVEIDSTYIWDSGGTHAYDYVVTQFIYDSTEHKTHLTFMPKSSIGYQPLVTGFNKAEAIEDTVKNISQDKYIPPPLTNEVA